jgi:hypothetical protein
MHDRGALPRTTLSLAWQEDDVVCLAIVGDGGALWREHGRDTILAECDLATEQVNALGPLVSIEVQSYLMDQRNASDAYQLALFCDGIGRGLGLEAATLWVACRSTTKTPRADSLNALALKSRTNMRTT